MVFKLHSQLHILTDKQVYLDRQTSFPFCNSQICILQNENFIDRDTVCSLQSVFCTDRFVTVCIFAFCNATFDVGFASVKQKFSGGTVDNSSSTTLMKMTLFCYDFRSVLGFTNVL